MEYSDEEDNYNYKLLPSFPNPFLFVTKLISLQIDIFSTLILSLASPFFSLFSAALALFRRPPPDSKQDYYFPPPTTEEEPPPSRAGGGSLLLGRIAMGLVAAAYVCLVLMTVMAVAAVAAVALVNTWVEEPVYVKESLQFDYTDAHPTAVFSFRHKAGVPVGQTLYVSLVLLIPESDYNRDIGIFQLTAELISMDGDLVAKSSHPCMLRFRSWPIRLMRTFIASMPLLLGLTTETQQLSFPILRHKETAFPRTALVRITLFPRAGTMSLPQFYEAHLVLKSRLPWMKGLVYRWKLTFYVWTTFYIFILLVMFLCFFMKPVIFPVMVGRAGKGGEEEHEPVGVEPARVRDETEVSESLRRWQRSRNKRKAALLNRAVPEDEGEEAASSISGVSYEEGSGDSESVCFRGVT